eukprot:3583298-Pleurochrysis_carterae.AAC.7
MRASISICVRLCACSCVRVQALLETARHDPRARTSSADRTNKRDRASHLRVRECARVLARACVRVCVCVCSCACVRACACACVRARVCVRAGDAWVSACVVVVKTSHARAQLHLQLKWMVSQTDARNAVTPTHMRKSISPEIGGKSVPAWRETPPRVCTSDATPNSADLSAGS